MNAVVEAIGHCDFTLMFKCYYGNINHAKSSQQWMPIPIKYYKLIGKNIWKQDKTNKRIDKYSFFFI